LTFQGGAHELFHLTAIILQLIVALAVGQAKFYEAGKFNLKFCDLFECEMGEASLRFAAENFANEDWEFAAVREHGSAHNFDGQAMVKLSARDHAVPVAAGTVAPRNECLILGWRGAMTSNVAVGEHSDNFRVGRWTLDPTMFVTTAEDVTLEFHGRQSLSQ
jgi:hypothetical protein